MRQNGKNRRVSCFDHWTLKQDFSRFKPGREMELDKYLKYIKILEK